MKTFTRILCLLLCLALTAGLVPAAAEEPVYVALGDSIADGCRLAGYTVPGCAPAESFPVLLAEAMGARLIPLAVSGMDTDGLLRALDTQTYREAVARANTITLTIGSNDLLLPAVDRLTSLSESVAQGNLSELLTDLGGVGDVLTSQEAQEEYARHVARFKENWETIIARIRALKALGGLRSRLSDLGNVDLAKLCRDCAAHPLMKNNPVSLDEEALREMFEALA